MAFKKTIFILLSILLVNNFGLIAQKKCYVTKMTIIPTYTNTDELALDSTSIKRYFFAYQNDTLHACFYSYSDNFFSTPATFENKIRFIHQNKTMLARREKDTLLILEYNQNNQLISSQRYDFRKPKFEHSYSKDTIFIKNRKINEYSEFDYKNNTSSTKKIEDSEDTEFLLKKQEIQILTKHKRNNQISYQYEAMKLDDGKNPLFEQKEIFCLIGKDWDLLSPHNILESYNWRSKDYIEYYRYEYEYNPDKYPTSIVCYSQGKYPQLKIFFEYNCK